VERLKHELSPPDNLPDTEGVKMADNMKGPFDFLSRKSVYSNPWLQVFEDQVVRPGGKEGYFGLVHMKPGSTVLALTDNGEAYLVKEYKYAIERESVELMSGALEGNETPLEAARRELKEETGLEARDWIDLGVVDPFTTLINSPNYMFLALGVREGESNQDEGEVLEVFKVPFAEAVSMVMRSEIRHAASCVLILKAQTYLKDLLEA
jgi:8-oxo-dGTP pyrophosphatase MutT (NUDIX family)